MWQHDVRKLVPAPKPDAFNPHPIVSGMSSSSEFQGLEFREWGSGPGGILHIELSLKTVGFGHWGAAKRTLQAPQTCIAAPPLPLQPLNLSARRRAGYGLGAWPRRGGGRSSLPWKDLKGRPVQVLGFGLQPVLGLSSHANIT